MSSDAAFAGGAGSVSTATCIILKVIAISSVLMQVMRVVLDSISQNAHHALLSSSPCGVPLPALPASREKSPSITALFERVVSDFNYLPNCQQCT
jgi:hypothetical protein